MHKNVMRLTTAICFVVTIIASILFYCFNRDIYLTLAVTFGTTAYHLGMRMMVGFLYHVFMKNRVDYTRKWFQTCLWEQTLYRRLKVKAWKNKMPTYNREGFSVKEHTLHEIAQAMCQSELVHETNIVLSFLPLIAVQWFGSFYVFLLTSIGGAIFDLVFVLIQRYNRPRVIRIAAKK